MLRLRLTVAPPTLAARSPTTVPATTTHTNISPAQLIRLGVSRHVVMLHQILLSFLHTIHLPTHTRTPCCNPSLCPPSGATELAQLFKNLGTPLSFEKVAEVFMRYDKDESGQIDLGEFLLMFQVNKLPLTRGHSIKQQQRALQAVHCLTQQYACALCTA